MANRPFCIPTIVPSRSLAIIASDRLTNATSAEEDFCLSFPIIGGWNQDTEFHDSNLLGVEIPKFVGNSQRRDFRLAQAWVMDWRFQWG